MPSGGDDGIIGGVLAHLPQLQQVAPVAPQPAVPQAAPQLQGQAAQGQNRTNEDTFPEKVFYATGGSSIVGVIAALLVTVLSKIGATNLITSSALIGGAEQIVNHFTGPTPTPKNTAVKGLVGAAVCVTNVMATHYLVTKEKGEEIEDGGTPATTIACAAAYGFAFGLQCAAGTAKREGVQGR